MVEREEILRLDDLSVGFRKKGGNTELLSSINATARQGEMISVIGANGVGKSTLLKSIIGLRELIGGSVYINEINLKEYSGGSLAGLLGFVGTSDTVSQNLTVSELVALGRFPYTNWIGNLKREDYSAIERAILSVGLSKFRNTKIGEMSDGERQRAMIARALAQDTQFLLLDEPTAFLDLPNRYELIYLLKQIIVDERKTVIYTTHDLQIALGESDKIWLLNSSTLMEGAPEDLILRNEFSKLFPESKLVFEQQSGAYIYPSRKQGKIRVTGNNPATAITVRAMERLKLDVCDETGIPELSVQKVAGSFTWLLSINDNNHKFSSIYELCNFIRRVLVT